MIDPDAAYRCPDCAAMRDSPTAYCDRCDYDPTPIHDRDPIGAIWNAAGGIVILFAIAIVGAGYLLTDTQQVDAAITRWEQR